MQFTVVIPFKPSNELKNDIDKGLKLLTTRYNTEAKKLKKRYDFWKNTKAYKIASANKQEREFWKERGFCKLGLFQTLFQMNDFKKPINGRKNIYDKTIVNSLTLHQLGYNLWSSFEKLIYGKGKNISHKSIQSLTYLKNGKRFTYLKLKITPIENSTNNDYNYYFEFLHKNKKGIQQHIDIKTDYEKHAFNNCDMRMVTIKKEIIRGKEKYFFHICFEGTPYNKGRALGTASVGIDPSLENMYACFSNGDMEKLSLIQKIDEEFAIYNKVHIDKIDLLRQKLDRQRRANNPDFFNENGTINREALKQANYIWYDSNGYKKTRGTLKEIQRKIAIRRKQCHFALANYILSKANNIIVEHNSFHGFVRRRKNIVYKSNGQAMSNRGFGRQICHGAPSYFITILKNKTLCWGERASFKLLSEFNGCTKFDHTSQEFNKEIKRNDKVVTLSNGDKVDRDLHAAMNILFCENGIEQNTRRRVEKSADHFNVAAMEEFYNQYKDNMKPQIKAIS